MVVFTSNGCPYARAWHDRLQAVARDYADRDVAVLQVVSNDDADHPEDSVEAMPRGSAAGELAGPFLRDADQSVAQAYGATATPEVFVIDRAGIVRYHGAPDANYDDPVAGRRWVREALDDVLAGREVARPPPRPRAARSSGGWSCSGGRAARPTARRPTCCEQTLDEIGKGDVHVVRREVRTRADAQRLGFPGSPTFHVGGRDLFPSDAPPALTCRVYQREDGRTPRCPTPPTSPLGSATCWPAPGSCPAGSTSASSGPPPTTP